MILPRGVLDDMIRHCKEEYPNEACGILSGKDGIVRRMYRMTNAEASPTGYYMRPEEQFKVAKEIRRNGEEILGAYHSHTRTEAYPSARDVREAYDDSLLYFILSLKDWQNPEIRAFWIRDGKAEEEEISIKEGVKER
ncbi:MAG: M67 family metallopeptidase [bacterium]